MGWYDSEGYPLDPTDTFVEGEMYRVELKIIPAQFEGSVVKIFVLDHSTLSPEIKAITSTTK